ncbi:penicillin-binding transpeptidase domain-containing protein [Patescibacteria group bacterium]
MERGLIYDRLGRPLVENVPFYRLKREADQSWEVLSREEALAITAAEDPSKQVHLDIGRDYLGEESLGHLLGYLGQTTPEEVSQDPLLQANDFVGRGGIEQQYDESLRGVRGYEIFETDALGKKVRLLGKVEPIAGGDLSLTIDLNLSQVAYQALEGRPGAVVVSRPQGEILAIVSAPGFEPNQMFFGLSQEKYQQILDDPLRPLFNRSLAGLYPPGSVFKMVTATAGLEEGKVTGETLFTDEGFIKVGDFTYRNWYFTQYGRTEGEINLVKALKRSTDTFFYWLGGKIGPEAIVSWAEKFGLGQLTGLSLPGEKAGSVPDPAWRGEGYSQRWFLGNTYHLAIGQADLMMTPLQVNRMTGVIASGGRLCRPFLVKGEKKECVDLGLKTETITIIKEGMKEACASGGTAYPLFDFDPAVACKTGTAQFGDPEERTHAWLTAFAPIENPEIVVTVLLEKGGEGSHDAAPVAKKVLEEWFENKSLE